VGALRLPENIVGKCCDPEATAHPTFSMLSLEHKERPILSTKRGQTAEVLNSKELFQSE
jgi:hypothetical protein